MSTIKSENRKTLMLFSGRAFPALAEEIAGELGVELTPTEIYEFASGELFVRYKESVRGSDAFVIQSMATPINTWVMETLIMVDALKRGSAKRITVVMPFYPYARQDKKHRGREPISARGASSCTACRTAAALAPRTYSRLAASGSLAFSSAWSGTTAKGVSGGTPGKLARSATAMKRTSSLGSSTWNNPPPGQLVETSAGTTPGIGGDARSSGGRRTAPGLPATTRSYASRSTARKSVLSESVPSPAS